MEVIVLTVVGAFSGKDPTKVDRSAAYAARHIAKNLVASGVANRVTIQIAYAIGIIEPVSIMIDTHNTSLIDEVKIEQCVRDIFDLTPAGIIESLNLLETNISKDSHLWTFWQRA